MSAHFYLNESRFATLIHDIDEHKLEIDQLVKAMEEILGVNVCSLYGPQESEFYSIEINGENIAQRMFSHYSDGEIRDLIVRTQTALASCPHFSEAIENKNNAEECLEFSQCGSLVSDMPPQNKTWWNEDAMHLVSAPEDVHKAVRKHFVATKIEQKHFPDFSGCMFPNLYWATSPENIKDTGLSYIENIAKIIRHLSYLNDFVSDDFLTSSEDNEIIAKAGSRGVEISPESPQTRHNKIAMRQRTVEIEGESICCEWHTKLDNTRGRIHFHISTGLSDKVRKLVEDKVVVGVVAEHLTT